MITSTEPAQFPLCQGMTPAPGLQPQVCPGPLDNGDERSAQSLSTAGTASKATARLCLSESTSLGSQNKPKMRWTQMLSSMKTGTSWACARGEHFVPGKLVKTLGVFSVHSWYSSYSALLTPSNQEISTQALKMFKTPWKLRLEPYLSASLARL